MTLELLRERTPPRSARSDHNFSGGPGAFPEPVLETTPEVPEVDLSLLGISHHSDWRRAAGLVLCPD